MGVHSSKYFCNSSNRRHHQMLISQSNNRTTNKKSSSSSKWFLLPRDDEKQEKKNILTLLSDNDPNLIELDLRCKGIDTAGIIALSDVLKNNTKLKVLLLSNNNINPDGAYALCCMLQVNKSITELDLENNNLGNKGGEMFGTMVLPYNTTLQELYLCCNSFTSNETKQCLLNGLVKNYYLHFFLIRNQDRLILEDRLIQKQINFYLRLNKSGRCLLRCKNNINKKDDNDKTDDDVPIALWPIVLSRSISKNDPDMIFYLIRAKPEIIIQK